jgi:PAP2 superfamily C-terminal
MRNIFAEHAGFWTPKHKRSFYLGLLLIVLALIIQISAGHYSSSVAATAGYEGDILLNNLPVLNLGFIIVGGAIIFWAFSFFMLSIRPRRLLFGVKAVALFIIIRAFFINLTHEGIYPGGALPNAGNAGFGFYHLLTFRGNLFFSGHTGFAFLMALIFWDNTFWRRFFIGATIVFGAAVLLAHVHYSIDVFAAPFIVYGIFAIAAKFFPRDYALMLDARKAEPLL